MSTSIEAYLQSEQATLDVATHVARGSHWSIVDHPRAWFAGKEGCWMQLKLRVEKEEVIAYFRPEGDRYIVTDLGDAVRALRLRTGVIDPEIALPTWASEGYCVPYVCTDYWPVLAAADAKGKGASAANLPAAIVRVMLAAYRVANLSPSPGT